MDDTDKERIANWRLTKQMRRERKWDEQNSRSYSSHFTLTDKDAADVKEFEEHLVRKHLGKGQLTRRMSTNELGLALRTWNLEELNQLWSMRREKLTYLEDAALLLAHIRHRSGIDPQLRPAAELLGYDAIQALQGVLEESGRLAVEQSLPPAMEAVVAEGKRVEQVLRVIREGQAEFRKRLVAHYGAVCMVTGTALESVIDAAHIVPYNGTSTNALNNGLLLRKDIHALFDAGLLTIGPDLIVYVTSGVDDPFYRSLDGKELTLNAPPKMSKEALRKRLNGHESSELSNTSLLK
ncbi:HNH endonuclease [Stenotrophomonas maltophilia]|uniref:HNH endonuclease n=1 Tax=Stenotrophomonas maltophilia TaxID=40324 RepID=UPI0039C4496F